MSVSNSGWPPTEPDDHNQETLEYLQRAIELADGFALLLARCDQPAQRDDLIARLDKLFSAQDTAARRLDVAPPATGLLAGLYTLCHRLPNGSPERKGPLEKEGTPDPPACVHICGLEDALEEDDSPVLERLNLARDRFRDLPCPLVFWLPDAALTRLAQGAPDFWAWRSGTFDFVPLVELTPTLTLRRAEEQIHTLENLLGEYASLGDGPTEQRARASLLVDLAALYRDTYRPQIAQTRLKKAVPLVRSLKDDTLKTRFDKVLRELDPGLDIEI